MAKRTATATSSSNAPLSRPATQKRKRAASPQGSRRRGSRRSGRATSSAAKKPRVDLSPILRLPQDILAIVFELYMLERFERTQIKSLRLAMVCRSWRDFVFSYPMLWTSIILPVDLAISSDIIQGWLCRSKRLDLHLTLIRTSKCNVPSRVTRAHASCVAAKKANFNLLLQELPRWNTLRLGTGALHELCSMGLTLTGHAPRLTEVEVLGYVPDYDGPDHEVFFGADFSAPALEELDLQAVPSLAGMLDDTRIPLNFPGITCLVVSWENLNPATSFEDFFRALSQLPALRILHLTGMVDEEWVNTEEVLFTFNTLGYLEFEDMDFRDAAQVFSFLKAPRLGQVAFSNDLTTPLSAETQSFLPLSRLDDFPRLEILRLDTFSVPDEEAMLAFFELTSPFPVYELHGDLDSVEPLVEGIVEGDPSAIWGAAGMESIKILSDVSGEWAIELINQINNARAQALADGSEVVPAAVKELRVEAFEELSEEARGKLETMVSSFEWSVVDPTIMECTLELRRTLSTHTT